MSLANVLYRSGFDKDATAVIHMSLEVCQRTAKCEVNGSPLRVAPIPVIGSFQDFIRVGGFSKHLYRHM